MKGECTCWMPYPNELMRKSNGAWKCVEKYENVRPLKGYYGQGNKTKCKRRSADEIAIVKERAMTRDEITREEAVERLEEATPYVADGIREALYMAIEALQQEPIVRCKDCKNAGRKMGTHYHCEQQMSWHEEEYFCSYGERREL